MSLTRNFTLLIQGPLSNNTIMMCNYHKSMRIVISCWEDQEWNLEKIHEFLEPIKRKNLVVCVNIFPDKSELDRVHNDQNRYLQFKSTLSGLSCVETKYTIKVRSDEYYSNLVPIMKTTIKDDIKMVTNDVFFRKTSAFLYHPSDHIICGRTDKLKRLFYMMLNDCEYNQRFLKEKPFNQKRTLVAEQQIAIKWIEAHELLKNRNFAIPSDPLYVNKLMKRYFDVVSSSKLGDFHIRANYSGRIGNYINDTSYRNPIFDVVDSLEEL